MITRFANPIFQRLVVAFLILNLASCGDPKREAELKWKEEQVAAKEADYQRREDEIAKRSTALDAIVADVKKREDGFAAREQSIVDRIAAVEKIEADMKAAKLAAELKLKRGSLPSLDGERILVIDPATNEVLFERNADRAGAIASTTKVMTALLIIEAGDLDKIVTIQDSDTRCAPVRMGLKTGEEYTRRNLLTALMVKSSNDIAQALARDNAGSVASFVAKMNERAKLLGCEKCLFINPNGLPPVEGQPDPYCTAHDLAKIVMVADKLPDLRQMVKLKQYTFLKGDGKSVVLDNTNRVLRSNQYCDGMKTGYTGAAGYCLVATGEKDGRRRIVIVLNSTQSGVWRDADSLLDWALKA
jgi:serine-type D-Ala-D-Ala carboxypeptidase (penicillin-binding protein 5/6)